MKYCLFIFLFISPVLYGQVIDTPYQKLNIEQGTGFLRSKGVFKDGMSVPVTNGLPPKSIRFSLPKGYPPFGLDTTFDRLWWYSEKGDSIAYTQVGGGGGSSAPSPLETILNNGSNLTTAHTITHSGSNLRFQGTKSKLSIDDATGFFSAQGADSVKFFSKGITTKVGLIRNPNSSTDASATQFGFSLTRHPYNLQTDNYGLMTTSAQSGFEVIPNINAFNGDSTHSYYDSTQLPAYATSLGTAFSTRLKPLGNKVKIVVGIANEGLNDHYYLLDSNSVSRRQAMSKVFNDTAHAYGYLTATDAFTGKGMKWLVYKDLLDHNLTAQASEFALNEFTTLERAGGLNWDITGAYVDVIAYMRKEIDAIKNSDYDYFNFHWESPTNGVDGSIDPNPFIWATQYFARATGKPVICNEFTIKTMSDAGAATWQSVASSINIPVFVLYEGTATTFNTTGVTFHNSDNTLRTSGSNIASGYTTLKNSIREFITLKNGVPSFPGLATGYPINIGTDSAGNLRATAVSRSVSSISTAAANYLQDTGIIIQNGTIKTNKNVVVYYPSTRTLKARPSSNIAGGYDETLVTFQEAYDNDNHISGNGWDGYWNPDGLNGQDSANTNINFYFGKDGIRNTGLANSGSYNAVKFDAQGNLVNTFISSGGGGTNNRQVYAGNGLNKVNDSTLELNVAYTNGLYPQLSGSYSNPAWINSLAYSKLTGAPTLLSQFTNDPGYLTSYTETDPGWTAASTNYYTKSQADSKYLQTETDPQFSANGATKSNTVTINGNTQTLGSNPSFTVSAGGVTYQRPVYAGTGLVQLNDSTLANNPTYIRGLFSVAKSPLLYNSSTGVYDIDTTHFHSKEYLDGFYQPLGSYTNGITSLTGDVTTPTGSGAQPATLATVNSTPGTFGSASQVPVFTTNGKGLTTTASSTSIQIAESQVTNLTTDLAGKQANLAYTPESVTNKATALTSPSNVTYPTTQAVVNSLYAKQNKLVQGTNITLTNNADSTTTISASSSGGSGTVTNFSKSDGFGIVSSVSNATTTPTHSIAADTTSGSTGLSSYYLRKKDATLQTITTNNDSTSNPIIGTNQVQGSRFRGSYGAWIGDTTVSGQAKLILSVWGDSYTAGSYYKENLSQALNMFLDPHGIAGTNLGQVAAGVPDSSIEYRIINQFPSGVAANYGYVVVAGTTNDVASIADTSKGRASYINIINSLTSKGLSVNQIVLSTSGYGNPVNAAAQVIRRNYVTMTRNVARHYGTYLADWFAAIEQAGGAAIERDGLHPNEDGSQILTNSFFQTITGQKVLPNPHGGALVVNGPVRFSTAYHTQQSNQSDAPFDIYNDTTAFATTGPKEVGRFGFSIPRGFFYLGNTGASTMTTSTDNTLIGVNTFTGLTTGVNNTAVGFQASYNALSTISNSTAIGTKSLSGATVGSATAVGNNSGLNSGSSAAVYVGNGAGQNSSGANPVAIGSLALSGGSTGSGNMAIGPNSLLVNTSGAMNLGIGTSTLSRNTTGSRNIALDQSAAANNVSGNDIMAIGNAAGGWSTSLATLTPNAVGSGYTTATVVFSGGGTGATLPTATVNIVGGQVTSYNIITPGSNLTAALTATVTGDGTGATATTTQETGGNNISIGTSNGAFGRGKSNLVYIGHNVANNATYYFESNKFRLGYNAIDSLNLLVGDFSTTNTAAAKLQINGALNIRSIPTSSNGTDSVLVTNGGTIYKVLRSSFGSGGGSGTVTNVSVASANGFAGTVANATTTPAITLSTTVTGLLKGNGTAISAATAGTDYSTATATETFTNKSISGASNTLTNIPQSAVTNLTTDLAAKLNNLHPVSIGGTPTVTDATGGQATYSISGHDAAMKLTVVVGAGQTISGSLCTINFASAWGAAPVSLIGWANAASTGTQVGANATDASTITLSAFGLSAGTYVYSIHTIQ